MNPESEQPLPSDPCAAAAGALRSLAEWADENTPAVAHEMPARARRAVYARVRGECLRRAALFDQGSTAAAASPAAVPLPEEEKP